MARVIPPPDYRTILHTRDREVLEAFQSSQAQALFRWAEERYHHWSKFRIVARQQGFDPEVAWAALKLTRSLSGRRWLPFRDVHGQELSYRLPDIVQRELMLIDQQLAGRLDVDETHTLTSDQRDRFVISSLMDEAIASSMLEGAHTTARVAKEMLRSGRKPLTHGERMVHNNYRAIQFAREHRTDPLTPELLVALQSLLTEETLDNPRDVGRIRTPDDPVRVVNSEGDDIFVPPHADSLNARLEWLCEFANARIDESHGGFIHPAVKAMLLHFMLAYLHPFCDGNGRTARILTIWSMLRNGYWLFEWIPMSLVIYESPAQYGRAFLYTETDEFDGTYFLVYLSRVLAQCRARLREHIHRKQEELARARDRFANNDGLNHRQQALLTHAIRHDSQVYTIESHRNSHGIAYATARSDLLDLVDRGYLARAKRGKELAFTPSEMLRNPR